MKKENAAIIEKLKEKLQIYKSKCNDLEKNDQLLNIKVSRLQGELRYMHTATFQPRQEDQLK